MAYAAQPIVHAITPEISLVYPAASLAKLALASLGVAALASLLPAYRIANVEPVSVFKE